MCTMNAYVTMQMLCLRLTTSTRQHLKACVQVADGNMFHLCHLCSLSVQQPKQALRSALHCTVKHSMSSPSLCFPGLRLSHLNSLCVACLATAHAVVGWGFVMTGCVPHAGLGHTRYPLKGKLYPPKASTCTQKEGSTVRVSEKDSHSLGHHSQWNWDYAVFMSNCKRFRCSWPTLLWIKVQHEL